VWSKLKKGSFGFSSGIIDFDELFANPLVFWEVPAISMVTSLSLSRREKGTVRSLPYVNQRTSGNYGRGLDASFS
jgi:hypothetical protein